MTYYRERRIQPQPVHPLVVLLGALVLVGLTILALMALNGLLPSWNYQPVELFP